MADESHVIRGINWRETFPFTQIFRAFRVAIHPTKLILALVALLALYAGGRILDTMWPVQSRAVPAVAGGVPATAAEMAADRETPGAASEVVLYETFRSGSQYASFESLREKRRQGIEDAYVQQLRTLNIEPDEAKARGMAKSGSGLGAVKEKLLAQRKERIDADLKKRDELLAAAKTSDDRDKIHDEYRRRVGQVTNDTGNAYR